MQICTQPKLRAELMIGYKTQSPFHDYNKLGKKIHYFLSLLPIAPIIDQTLWQFWKILCPIIADNFFHAYLLSTRSHPYDHHYLDTAWVQCPDTTISILGTCHHPIGPNPFLTKSMFNAIQVLKVNIAIQIRYGVHEQAKHLHPCPIVCHNSTNELINSEFKTSVNE